MKIDYSKDFLLQLLERQLNIFMITSQELDVISENLNTVLNRTEYCFKDNSNKYYSKDGEVYFNPFHSGQWAIFLYFLSNTLFEKDLNNRLISSTGTSSLLLE